MYLFCYSEQTAMHLNRGFDLPSNWLKSRRYSYRLDWEKSRAMEWKRTRDD